MQQQKIVHGKKFWFCGRNKIVFDHKRAINKIYRNAQLRVYVSEAKKRVANGLSRIQPTITAEKHICWLIVFFSLAHSFEISRIIFDRH